MRHAALTVAIAIAIGAGALALTARDEPPTAPIPAIASTSDLRADAYVGPKGELRISWQRMTRAGEPRSAAVVRRGDGTTRVFGDLVGPDIVLPRGRIGERIVLAVVERIGSSTVSGRTRIRVRAPTRIELCLPAPLGAYPSYCAPENVSQEG
jgi:hypothetical protein